jgi:hypothetical protein
MLSSAGLWGGYYMKLSVKQFVETYQLDPAQTLLQQDAHRLPSPRTAFPGQDLSALLRGIREASMHVQDDTLMSPRLDLKLFTIENGMFFVGHQLDGTILTPDGHPIHQTAAFRGLKEVGEKPETMLDPSTPYQLDQVFLGFDGAWRNYFHWMCFGLTKSFLGNRYLDRSVTIAIPDYRSALSDGAISYSETTWQQSLEFSDLAERVTLLPKGVYKARKVHFLWTNPAAPTDIMYLDAFKHVFDAMIGYAIPTSKDFEKIYLSRSKHVSNRMGGNSASIVARVLEQRGFRTVGFEGADLQQQISIFANAKQIVSPHGAGLTNTLFHPGGLRVLELNQTLDGSSAFRPWFYVTSAIRGHRYLTLDSTMPDFSEEHVNSAVSALGD